MTKSQPPFFARVGKIEDLPNVEEGQQKARAVGDFHRANRSTEILTELTTKQTSKIMITGANNDKGPGAVGLAHNETTIVNCVFTREGIELLKEAVAIAKRDYSRRPDDPSAVLMAKKFQALANDIVLIREVVNP